MTTIRRAKVPFEIHHDDMERSDLDEDLEKIEDSRGEGDEDDREDDYSEESDDSDDIVDAAVQ